MRIRTHRARDRDDRGQVALEYIGFVAILLLVGLAAIQLGVAAYAVNQAGTGARAAARAASLDDPKGLSPEAAVQAAVRGWLHPDPRGSVGGDEATYTVTVTIPSVIPGIPDFGTATRTSTMPKLQPPN
ncbi:septum site-determining protein [Streptomyces sp. NPDC050516]|uniref:septum site-determining protein n=1 Tax=Streptomyces sp. NPDC050516 TaxID=3365621 RepID=UPI00378B2097